MCFECMCEFSAAPNILCKLCSPPIVCFHCFRNEAQLDNIYCDKCCDIKCFGCLETTAEQSDILCVYCNKQYDKPQFYKINTFVDTENFVPSADLTFNYKCEDCHVYYDQVTIKKGSVYNFAEIIYGE